jgi:hypothetical protein
LKVESGNAIALRSLATQQKNGWPNEFRPAVFHLGAAYFGVVIEIELRTRNRRSIRVAVAPLPIFLMLFVIGFGEFVFFVVLFREEAAPGRIARGRPTCGSPCGLCRRSHGRLARMPALR